MAAAATPNLGLPQWTGSEELEGHVMNDFNAAFLAIDGIGVMAAWTPTLSGITIGSGTVDARYCKIGKLVYFEINIVLAANSSITGAVSFSIPSASRSTRFIYGFIIDAGATFYMLSGEVIYSACNCWAVGSAGGYVTPFTALSSTVPMTWATGDSLHLSGTYEVA